MLSSKLKPQKVKRAFNLVLLSLLCSVLVILSSCFIKLQVAARHAPLPEAILVLGGGRDREKAAAQIAAAYPDFDV